MKAPSLFACLAALVFAPAAAADVRYAEPGGNGPSGDMQCLSSNPCDIQDAVEDPSVVDGDRVVLLAGPYNLGTDQLLISDDIVIEPAPGLPRQTLSSTFAMTGWAVGVDPAQSAPGAVLRRLLISHNSGGASPTTLFLKDATAERVYVVSDGFLACALTTGTLRDSVCFLTAAASATAIGAVGMSQGGGIAQTSTVRNVTAISKQANAPAMTLSAVAGANLTLNGRNVIAESTNFDVFANAGAGSTATIALANSNYPSFDAAGAGGSVTSNSASGNQATPPVFANFAGNDFKQAPSSPTIDAGAIDPFVGALDVDGNPRVVQGRPGCPNALPDIGAYEAPAVAPQVCLPPPSSTQPAQVPVSGPPAKCKKKKKGKKSKKRCGKRKKKRK